MKLEINIDDRQFAIISASLVIILVLLGMAGAYNDPPGPGDPPIMGHSIDEINWDETIEGSVSVTESIISPQYCDGNGENCKSITETGISCVRRSLDDDGSVTVYCEPGEFVTGGGYRTVQEGRNIYRNMPLEDLSGWQCRAQFDSTDVYCYAICCKNLP